MERTPWALIGRFEPLGPDGIDEVDCGGGLGPVAGKVWRIGCMGHTARHRNVTLLLGALRELLQAEPARA